MPAVHAMHVPPLHTIPVPHDCPFATFPVAMHTSVPVPQVVEPVWQALPPGTQTLFAVQALQLPALQTRLVPHEVPFATIVVASVQTGVPPAHDSVPL